MAENEDYAELQASIEAEQAAYEAEGAQQGTQGKPKAGLALNPVPRYVHQLVVDVDTTVENPVTISHSFGSDMLYVSCINTGGPANTPPAIWFMDENTIQVTSAPGSVGNFRLYITVIPPG